MRRTRQFVKRYYPNDTVELDGRPVPITFPTPRVRKVDYDLDAVLPDFFDRFSHALSGPTAGSVDSDPNVLTLARYVPSLYRKTGEAESHEVQLAGLVRTGLLKRFESSSHAFARTCRAMAEGHDAFLGLLEQGKVAIGAPLRDWAPSDSDEIEEFLTKYEEGLEDAVDFDVDMLAGDVEADRDLLLSFAAEAESVTPDADPKLAALVRELADTAAEAEREGLGDDDVRDKRKILVFSYFQDTVQWIAGHLADVIATDARLSCYRGRVVALGGSLGSKEDALWGFAPRTTDAPPGRDDDRYDVVVTTDVLAEGVNLQQARHIVNCDLPWNPMRLVQRHGRIDRIGSPHAEVFLRCVFPDRHLDDLLGLEELLHRKIKQAAASVGVGEVLPGSRAEHVVFSETREEIDRLRAEDATLFERGGTGGGAISGEEFRQELRVALEDPVLAAALTSLPWGSGSGMAVAGSGLGYVFCCRVADHPVPLLRRVDYPGEGGEPEVIDDTLACLAAARPLGGAVTPRVLDDAAYAKAFEAWATARDHVLKTWNAASDPANLAPRVPASMQRAAQLVREHRPPEMTMEESDRLVATLEAPYPERTAREIRRATDPNLDEVERVRRLAVVVRDLGLEPSPQSEPVAEIVEGDVHLVCWIALVPGESEGRGEGP